MAWILLVKYHTSLRETRFKKKRIFFHYSCYLMCYFIIFQQTDVHGFIRNWSQSFLSKDWHCYILKGFKWIVLISISILLNLKFVRALLSFCCPIHGLLHPSLNLFPWHMFLEVLWLKTVDSETSFYVIKDFLI